MFERVRTLLILQIQPCFHVTICIVTRVALDDVLPLTQHVQQALLLATLADFNLYFNPLLTFFVNVYRHHASIKCSRTKGHFSGTSILPVTHDNSILLYFRFCFGPTVNAIPLKQIPFPSSQSLLKSSSSYLPRNLACLKCFRQMVLFRNTFQQILYLIRRAIIWNYPSFGMFLQRQ